MFGDNSSKVAIALMIVGGSTSSQQNVVWADVVTNVSGGCFDHCVVVSVNRISEVEWFLVGLCFFFLVRVYLKSLVSTEEKGGQWFLE